MKILNLGAAGQISRILTGKVLDHTDFDIVLYARNASRRLNEYKDNERVTIIDGDFLETDKLEQAMSGADVVYVNDMSSKEATQSIVQAMDNAGVKRVIAATVLNIYGEVTGGFRKYTDQMVGGFIPPFTKTAEIIEATSFDYTLMRLPWLYNDASKTEVTLTEKGEDFKGTQVSRHAVAHFVLQMIESNDPVHYKQSYSVSEPNTDWERPSFFGFR